MDGYSNGAGDHSGVADVNEGFRIDVTCQVSGMRPHMIITSYKERLVAIVRTTWCSGLWIEGGPLCWMRSGSIRHCENARVLGSCAAYTDC